MRNVSDTLAGQAGLLVELLTASMGPELEKAGLTLSSFELLSAVHASGGKASQAEIARRLGITPPSLSEAVQFAARQGFVEQVADTEDRRLKRLRLTTSGRKAVHVVTVAIRETEESVLSQTDPGRLEEALKLLREVNRNLARRLNDQRN